MERPLFEPVPRSGPFSYSRQDAPLAENRVAVTPPEPQEDLNRALYGMPRGLAPGESAEVTVQLDIGMRGTVTGCTVVAHAKAQEVGADSCERMMAGLRFNPALDAAGEPVASTFVAKLHWPRAGTSSPAPVMPAVRLPRMLPVPAPWAEAPQAINPGAWFRNTDYPARILRAERQGTTGFVLTIDAAGVPVGCEISFSSGVSLLDDLTCDLLVARARFTPAKDSAGKPVPSTYRSRMIWSIPRD